MKARALHLSLMRTVSALAFAGVLAIPGMLVGLMLWYLLGQPEGTWNLGVVFACNVVPLGSVLVGAVLGWRAGQDPGQAS